MGSGLRNKKRPYSIRLMFPSAILAFSEMIPRPIRSPSGSLFYLDRIRRCLNRTIHNFLLSSGGVLFCHAELEGFVPGLFCTDMVHLSAIGLYIFNMGLQNLIKTATVGSSRPALFNNFD